MIVPLKWLNEYIDTKGFSSREITDSLTSLGLLLDKPLNEAGVLDLEHRMDRADWLSILGVARDLAAYKNIKLKYPQIFERELETKNKIKLEVLTPEKVIRFNTLVFEDITVKDSPKWLKERLEQYGIPSINNVVDITNYVMVETGQPLHAQDTDKFEKPEIIIRNALPEEKITTLDGTKLKLDEDIFVLTQNNKPTVIGGIVGGKTTAVDEQTTNIVLDAGTYNQANIRNSSRKLKIYNETVLRTDKFMHPTNTEFALLRATKLILDLAGGRVYKNQDYYPAIAKPKHMELNYARIKALGGIELSDEEVKNILTRLEYRILNENSSKIAIEVPFFRTDVEVEDDIVSDVLRINGYNKIPIKMMSQTPPSEITPKIITFEDKLRNDLVGLGLHEHITDPLVEKSTNEQQVQLQNALTIEKAALRSNIIDTLRPISNSYVKSGQAEYELFEIGKEYFKDKEAYVEKRVVGIVVKKNSKQETLHRIKQIVFTVLRDLGVEKYHLTKHEEKIALEVNSSVIAEWGSDWAKIYTQPLLDSTKECNPNRVKTDIEIVKYNDITKELSSNQEHAAAINELVNSKTSKRVYKIAEYKKSKSNNITFRVETE